MTRVLLAATAAVLGVLVYLNALYNPFVYDDYRTILANGSILNLAQWQNVLRFDLTRPLTNLSFALDYAWWGGAPWGFHVTSVALHTLNVLLLFSFGLIAANDLQRAGSAGLVAPNPTVVAFVAAALFAVHPVMTEAVGYISSRSDVLSATFVLAALLAGRHWMTGRGFEWGALTVLLWITGLATKETAVMLPVLLLIYDRLVLPDDGRRQRVWRFHAPLFAIALVLGILRLTLFVAGEHGGRPALSWTAFLDQLDATRRYVGLLSLTVEQAIYHSPAGTQSLASGPALFSLATIATILGLAWWLRRRQPLASAGLVWFLVMLLPPAGVALLGEGDAIAEHRAYLASCGLFLTAGTLMGALDSRFGARRQLRWLLATAVITVLLSLGSRTLVRNIIWSDPLALWAEAAALAPGDPLAHIVLGESLHAAGQHDEAIAEFRRALGLDPGQDLVYLKVATCLSEAGRFAEASAEIDGLRRIHPQSAVVPISDGMIALLSGQTEAARLLFERALSSDEHRVLALRWLAVLEEDHAKNSAAAADRCRQIERLLPGDVEAANCIARNTR